MLYGKSNINVINNKFNVTGTQESMIRMKISLNLYNRRHEEEYDIYDESYVRWLKLYHPDDMERTGCQDWKLHKKLDE